MHGVTFLLIEETTYLLYKYASPWTGMETLHFSGNSHFFNRLMRIILPCDHGHDCLHECSSNIIINGQM